MIVRWTVRCLVLTCLSLTIGLWGLNLCGYGLTTQIRFYEEAHIYLDVFDGRFLLGAHQIADAAVTDSVSLDYFLEDDPTFFDEGHEGLRNAPFHFLGFYARALG